MSARAALHTLLEAARAWHAVLPELANFTAWPGDLAFRDRPAVALPHVPLLTSNPGNASRSSFAFRDALVAAAPHVEWRHTYTEEEVGRDMLDGYGWFELAGPDGHFATHQTRMTIGYWAPGLYYDWHQHLAEELYSVVSGAGVFMVEGEADQALTAGGTRFHASQQRHALRTLDQPVLTFVLWRGDGLDDPPRMSV